MSITWLLDSSRWSCYSKLKCSVVTAGSDSFNWVLFRFNLSKQCEKSHVFVHLHTTKGWILCANVCVKNNQIYVLHFEMYTYEPDVDFKHLYILSIMLVYFFIFILDTLQSSPTVWNIMLDFYGFYPLLSAKTMNSVETHRRWRCLISHEFSAS